MVLTCRKPEIVFFLKKKIQEGDVYIQEEYRRAEIKTWEKWE